MATSDDFAVQLEPPRLGVICAGTVGGTQGKAVDIGAVERRHVDRCGHVVRQHAPERRGKGHALARKRREVDMACKASARLLGRDDFEELLLPRRAADQFEKVVAADRLSRAIAHGNGLTTTSLPTGKPSLSAGTTIHPSACASTPSGQ